MIFVLIIEGKWSWEDLGSTDMNLDTYRHNICKEKEDTDTTRAWKNITIYIYIFLLLT